MGIDYTTYLGPYAHCVCAQACRTRKERGCSKCGQVRYSNALFCSECGSEIGEIELSYLTDAVEPFAVSEAIKEELYSTAMWDSGNSVVDGLCVHLWLPNKNSKSGGGFSFNPTERDFLHLWSDAEDIKIAFEMFQEEYAEALSYLKITYGENNVEIRWGLIHQAH